MAPSDAEHALAFVAKRQGKGSVPESQWAHVLSLELGWLTPSQAKRFVANARDTGVLVDDPDGPDRLRFAGDWRSLEVPRRFRLDPEAIEDVPAPAASPTPAPAAASDDPFRGLLDAIAAHRGDERAAVMDDVSTWQDRMGGDLEAEAAALLVAAEAGMDVKARATQALERLKGST